LKKFLDVSFSEYKSSNYILASNEVEYL